MTEPARAASNRKGADKLPLKGQPTRAVGLALVALCAAWSLPAPIRAEPLLAARAGLRCARCHTSPTGGGKRTPYAALYALTHLSLLGPGGETRPPHGVPAGRRDGGWAMAAVATGEVTSWLAVGADLRLTNRTTFGEETNNTFDTSGGNLYLELRPWPDRLVLYVDQAVGESGIRIREGWALVQGPLSTYLRGGRLLPPFGLRVLDDAALTRRVTGATFSNSDLGLEAGLDLGPLFLALAVTNGSFSAEDTDSLKAFWGLVEMSLGPARLGLSGAHNPSDQGCRSMAGVHGAADLGRLALQAEVDFVAGRPADSERWTYQIAALVEAGLQVLKGLSFRAAYEIHDADLELSQDRRQRLRLGLDLFLLPMSELKLLYVLQQSETSTAADRADILEVTLHVYL